MTQKRKQTFDNNDGPSARPPKVAKANFDDGVSDACDSKPKSQSRLIPIGDRINAVLGTKDERLLRQLVQDVITGVEKELHFSKIIYDRIDWNSKADISAINEWKGQIFARSGRPVRTITIWHPDEDLFLELFWQLLIVAAQERKIIKPPLTEIRKSFNDFFKGRILQDKNGKDLPPRSIRLQDPFKAKMCRTAESLKYRFDACIKDKKGPFEHYIPHITTRMLSEYRTLKQSMISRSIASDVALKEAMFPNSTTPNNSLRSTTDKEERDRHLQAWLHFYSNIPEEQDDDVELASSLVELSSDHAEELYQLATSNFEGREDTETTNSRDNTEEADVQPKKVTKSSKRKRERVTQSTITGKAWPDDLLPSLPLSPPRDADVSGNSEMGGSPSRSPDDVNPDGPSVELDDGIEEAIEIDTESRNEAKERAEVNELHSTESRATRA